MTRTRVRWSRITALLTSVFILISLGGRALGGSSPETAGERTRPRILVRAGQTLWSIARARIGAEGDPRPYIEEVRDLNGLATSELRVGQTLFLP